MANAKVLVLFAVLALLQVSGAVSRRHGKPSPCDNADTDLRGGTSHNPCSYGATLVSSRHGAAPPR
jgi:hypothetical protein